jgi:hypothetical protein
MSTDERDLIHARALILKCTHGPNALDVSGKGIGFATQNCDSVCCWDRGLGPCRQPIARVCLIWTPDIVHTVVFCEYHGEVIHAAQEEFRRANPRD